MCNVQFELTNILFFQCCVQKQDSSGSSEEETSTAMAHSGRYNQKIEESDDDFNSNQFSSETTLSVLVN